MRTIAITDANGDPSVQNGVAQTITIGLPGTHPGPAEDGAHSFIPLPEQEWRSIGIPETRFAYLTLAVAGWQGFFYNGDPAPCTLSAVRTLLTVATIRQQIDKALRDIERAGGH